MADSNGLLDALVDHCPSWGYGVLLLVALGVSMKMAGVGMRAAESLFSWVRR